MLFLDILVKEKKEIIENKMMAPLYQIESALNSYQLLALYSSICLATIYSSSFHLS